MTAREKFERRVTAETDWIILDGRPSIDFFVIWNSTVVAVRLSPERVRGKRRYDIGRVERTGTAIATTFDDVKTMLVGFDQRDVIAKRKSARRDWEEGVAFDDAFTPSLVDNGHGTMLVALETCQHCERKIVRYDTERIDGPFPNYYAVNFDAQIKRAGWRRGRRTVDGDGWICDACEKSGKDVFVCKLCGKKRPTNEIQDRIGDPPDILCTTCHTTKSAKEYGDKLDELNEGHRYDHC